MNINTPPMITFKSFAKAILVLIALLFVTPSNSQKTAIEKSTKSEYSEKQTNGNTSKTEKNVSTKTSLEKQDDFSKNNKSTSKGINGGNVCHECSDLLGAWQNYLKKVNSVLSSNLTFSDTTEANRVLSDLKNEKEKLLVNLKFSDDSVATFISKYGNNNEIDQFESKYSNTKFEILKTYDQTINAIKEIKKELLTIHEADIDQIEVNYIQRGMTDEKIENMVKENIELNHGKVLEIIIESEDWTVNHVNGIPEYAYIRVFGKYKTSDGRCRLIEHSVEKQFDILTSSFGEPYCRGNGYGEGLLIDCTE